MIRCNGIEIDRARRIITHRDRFRHFVSSKPRDTESIVFQSFVYLILGGGVSTAQLFWHVYGNDPEGGPNRGPDIFCTRFHQWECVGHFRALDLELISWKIAGVIFYEIVPASQAEARRVAV